MYDNNYGIYNNNYKLLDQKYTLCITQLTRLLGVKCPLHLNAFACPSPIEERKWGRMGVVARGRVPPSKTTLIVHVKQ